MRNQRKNRNLAICLNFSLALRVGELVALCESDIHGNNIRITRTEVKNYTRDASGNHAIRKTCISELHDSQLLLDRMISDFAGHKNISTTQKYYIHSITPLVSKTDVFEKVLGTKRV